MEQEAKENTTAVSVLDDYSVIVVDQERRIETVARRA